MKKIYIEPKSEYVMLNGIWVMSGASGDTGVGTDSSPMPKKRTPAF